MINGLEGVRTRQDILFSDLSKKEPLDKVAQGRTLALVFLILLFLLASCVTIVPSRQPTDYFQSNDLSNFSRMQPTVTFLELEKEEISQQFASGKQFEVVLFASWCPQSYTDLQNGVYKHYQDSIPYKVYFVHTNDNASKWDKFSPNQLPDTVYLMSKSFGETEKEKINSMRKILCDSCEGLFAVPQYLKVEGYK